MDIFKSINDAIDSATKSAAEAIDIAAEKAHDALTPASVAPRIIIMRQPFGPVVSLGAVSGGAAGGPFLPLAGGALTGPVTSIVSVAYPLLTVGSGPDLSIGNSPPSIIKLLSPGGVIPFSLRQNVGRGSTPSIMYFETLDGPLGGFSGYTNGFIVSAATGLVMGFAANGRLSPDMAINTSGVVNVNATPISLAALAGINALNFQTVAGVPGAGATLWYTTLGGTVYGQLAAASTPAQVLILLSGAGIPLALASNNDLTAPSIQIEINETISFLRLLRKYNAITTVGNGIPSLVAKTDLTAQSAAIAATTIYAVPATGAGQYRVSWSAVVTTAGAVSSVLGGAAGFQVPYTDNDTGAAATPPANPLIVDANNIVGTSATSGSVIVNCKASTNLQFQYGYTNGGGAAMQFAIHVKVECLG